MSRPAETQPDIAEAPALIVGGIVDDQRSSDQIDAIASALAKAQAKITAASKDRTNPHFGQKYATLASVIDASREALTANGIAVLQPVCATMEDGVAVVRVRTILLHSSGQWLGMTLAIQARDGGPQAVGSCITYGRRYGLSCMAGVAPDDDDGNEGQGVGTVGAKPAAKPAEKPAPTIRSKVVAPCTYCGDDVAIGAGCSRKGEDGKWRTIHDREPNCLALFKAEQAEAEKHDDAKRQGDGE